MSSSFARGNENNRHEPDGTYYLGAGRSRRLRRRQPRRPLSPQAVAQIVAQINNLFDRRYYTAAQLGPTGFTDTGTFIARPFPAVDGEFPVQQATFFAPGAPARVWVGTRFKF